MLAVAAASSGQQQLGGLGKLHRGLGATLELWWERDQNSKGFSGETSQKGSVCISAYGRGGVVGRGSSG